MRFTIFTLIAAMAVLAAATPVAELARRDWKSSNGMIIPLTKRPSLLKADSEDIVSLNALYSHVESVDTKILRGLEIYQKNTGIPHPLAVKGVEFVPLNSKRAGVGASLTSSSHIVPLWYTTVWIGTPAKPFTVNIDTGSSDLFVPGPICSNCEGRIKWDPESSRTSNNKEMAFEIIFGNGAIVSGKQYVDNVTITGLTADHQTIGAAATYSPIMEVSIFPPDGMLGLAFQSISAYHDSPLFETLINEQKVEQPVFSIKLTSTGGELYLGGSNRDLYTGDIDYIDVGVVGFWMVTIASIQGNHEVLLIDIPAIVDTGSNFIIGDPLGVYNLHTNLGSKSVADRFYSFPCNKFPTISFAFGGTNGRAFHIRASLLNLGPVSNGSPDCWSSIISGRTERQHWTIGAAFLMGVYTVFDFGNKRVGFADLAT